MQNITIVCGAGVSSTFLAHRLAAAAVARDLTIAVTASSLSGLPAQTSGSVILLGPHLRDRRDTVAALHREAHVAVITESILTTLDGEAALDLALATGPTPEPSPTSDSPTAPDARSSTHG